MFLVLLNIRRTATYSLEYKLTWKKQTNNDDINRAGATLNAILLVKSNIGFAPLHTPKSYQHRLLPKRSVSGAPSELHHVEGPYFQRNVIAEIDWVLN